MTSETRSRTVMFTDVEGSTSLRETAGDRVADDVLAAMAEIVREAIATHGGREVQFLGDGFMIAFDEPQAALAAALDIQRAVAAHGRADPDHSARIRIGLHHGEVAESEGNVHGQVVHGAARVTAQAAGGQIIASAAVRAEVVGSEPAPLVDLGLFWLKGFPERWRLYEVQWDESQAAVAHQSRRTSALTPLVERDQERADIRRAMDGALVGRGRLVMVTGEAGVGKSRLVSEVSDEAAGRGMRVLVGHCVELSSSIPYLPWVEMIEQAVIDPRSPLALREALGDAAPEIARIAPVLRRVFPDIAAPVELPPELARRYLWNSLHDFIEAGAQTEPLLLVLEDLHWADESTILFTEFLAPLLEQMPVLVIGTYRAIELPPGHVLARSVNSLARRRLVDRVDLHRLSRAGVEAMVAEMARQPPPSRLVELVEAESEGNPFFVEEVFLHLAESQDLLDERGRLRSDVRIDEVDVPESIRLVIGERLERLSPGVRSILLGAAVLGRVFDPDLAAILTDIDPVEMVERLAEAERARLIEPSKGDARMLFSHELIRQTLLADTSTLEREALHLKAATVIEQWAGDQVDAHAVELATHLERAGRLADRTKLVRYLSISARRAMEAAAFEDAVEALQRAITYDSSGDDVTRAGLLEQLATALRSTGRWDDAIKTMDEALDLYERADDKDGFGRLAWTMVYQLTWAARFAEAVDIAQRALAVLGESPGGNGARLMSAAGWALSLSGDYETATGMFDRSRAIAEAVNDQAALADVLHMETIHHMGYAEFEQGVEAGTRAAEMFEASGALWDLASVLAFVIYQDGTLGRQEKSTTLTEKTATIAQRLGHLGSIFMLLAERARLELMRGEVAAVATSGAEMVEVCEQGGLPWLYVGHLYLGLAAFYRGDLETAESELLTATELEPAAAFAGQSASLLAGVYAHEGRRDDVLRLFEAAQPGFPVADRVNSLGAWNTLFGFTEALYLVGEEGRAAGHLPLISQHLASGAEWISFDAHLISTRAAMAAAAAQEWDLSDRYLDTAENAAAQQGNSFESAYLVYVRALLLSRRPGGDHGARDLAEEASRRFEAMNMTGAAAWPEEVLQLIS